jgi:nucleoid DNA-binding protein
MTKNELAKAVASRTSLSPAQARSVVETFVSAISDELARGGEIVLTGFGKFSVGHRAARLGRNPSTGATIGIAASRAPRFVPASSLKTRLNAQGTTRGGGAKGVGGQGRGAKRVARGTPTSPAAASRSVQSKEPRFLTAEGPETVPVEKAFSLLARVALQGPGAELSLAVPPGGLPLLLVAYAPGLDAVTETRQELVVPADRDSDPVLFEFIAPSTGAYRVRISAWNAGTYAGEVEFEVLAEAHVVARSSRERQGRADLTRRDGAVSLVVRFYPRENVYRFEFHDVDHPREVTGSLTYDPVSGVRDTIANLNALARGRTNYSAEATREYLTNAGVALWQELLPKSLRDQFWSRRSRIRELTIFTDNDRVPWELLYPMDPGHHHGFLVEQFPVMRGVFDRAPSEALRFRPARFVLAEDSPAAAGAEIEAIRKVFGMRRTKTSVVADLDSLNRLVSRGNFGLLHFACHNDSSRGGGEGVIMIGSQAFTPLMLAKARTAKSLARAKPLVFINACASADASPRYSRLDGWAEAFLGAGAAAFAGSLWEVRDGTAREFAEALYTSLKDEMSLGKAVMEARRAAAKAGDPTWLAYSVYGDANARISEHDDKSMH